MGADPHLVEPVQMPGELWGDFYDCWAASPFGVAGRAKAEELRRTIGAEHRAETARDARLADNMGRFGVRFAGQRPSPEDS